MGRLAAAQLLREAALLLAGSAAVRVGWLRLRAELACPDTPEPVVSDDDRELAAALEAVPA